MLKDEAKLKSVLSYHVVSEALPASVIAARKSLETLTGQPIQIGSDEGVKIKRVQAVGIAGKSE